MILQRIFGKFQDHEILIVYGTTVILARCVKFKFGWMVMFKRFHV